MSLVRGRIAFSKWLRMRLRPSARPDASICRTGPFHEQAERSAILTIPSASPNPRAQRLPSWRASSLSSAARNYHLRGIGKRPAPEQFHRTTRERECSGINTLIVLPNAHLNIGAAMGADIIFPVSTLQKIDPELHRSTLALILSEVEGLGVGLRRLRPVSSHPLTPAFTGAGSAQDESCVCGTICCQSPAYAPHPRICPSVPTPLQTSLPSMPSTRPRRPEWGMKTRLRA